MSVDGTGNVNVFFSSPRVGFGEPPPTTTTSSLLTFADMVLALDHRNVTENVEIQSSNLDTKGESDHTYASSRSSRITRSQTAKAAALTTSTEQDDKEVISSRDNFVSDNCYPSPSCSTEDYTSQDDKVLHLKGKRCSSVENIHNADSHFPVGSACEWPQVLPKNSPRKSCSFEEVSCDNTKSCIKSSKSTENVHRTGVSHTLHRFVNNTLEFPCWPRKADHTYATATWDGTAASHSLFEHELHQDSYKPNSNIVEDQEMEETDHDYSSQLQNLHCGEEFPAPTTFQTCHNTGSFISFQKDDHTYVKFKSALASNVVGNTELEEMKKSDDVVQQSFSSATFPRQKMREDHTYFHSGLSRKSSSGCSGREWASAQTVASSLLQQDMQIEEAYRNLHSFSHSASAKKDHNYSTSA